MSNSLNDSLRPIWEEHRQQIIKKINAAYDQLNSETNKVNKVSINNQIEGLEKELQDFDNKLLNFSNNTNSPQSNRNLHNEFQDRILEIDFEKAVQIINKFKNLRIDRRNAIIFLMQDFQARAGNYCIARIKKLLGTIDHDMSFKIDNELPIQDVLCKLAERVDVKKASPDLSKYAQNIAENICMRPQNGEIVFIEIDCWNKVKDPIESLDWFINNFWQHLLQCSPKILERNDFSEVCFVTAITFQTTSLEQELKGLKYYNKNLNHFDETKIFELVLEKDWKEEYIKRWLKKHAKDLSPKYRTCPDKTISEKANDIFKMSRKVPTSICENLKKEITPNETN